ncbi:MAG: glycosyltransferase, partial [Clostridiales bacterium]|nr:glycosyltransferase [Clostridiales bacterium]
SYGVHTGITPIPTGIELDRFAPGRYSRAEILRVREDLGIGSDEKVLLYLGRMAEEKNIQELLVGLHRYLRDTPGVRLLLVGDGADRPRLEGIAGELGLGDRAIFAGARPWADIGLYYQAGDVFINTSQSEAQGLTYIEAMAAGLPVVAKADRCLEGVLHEGADGYTFSDQDGLVSALDRVLRDKDERERLGRGALQTAAGFSATEYARRVSGEYADLLERAQKRSA